MRGGWGRRWEAAGGGRRRRPAGGETSHLVTLDGEHMAIVLLGLEAQQKCGEGTEDDAARADRDRVNGVAVEVEGGGRSSPLRLVPADRLGRGDDEPEPAQEEDDEILLDSENLAAVHVDGHLLLVLHGGKAEEAIQVPARSNRVSSASVKLWNLKAHRAYKL